MVGLKGTKTKTKTKLVKWSQPESIMFFCFFVLLTFGFPKNCLLGCEEVRGQQKTESPSISINLTLCCGSIHLSFRHKLEIQEF